MCRLQQPSSPDQLHSMTCINLFFVTTTLLSAAPLARCSTLTENCDISCCGTGSPSAVTRIGIPHPKCVISADSLGDACCHFLQHDLPMSPQQVQQQVGGCWRQGLDFGTFLLMKNVKQANYMDVPGSGPCRAMKKGFAASIRSASGAPPSPNQTWEVPSKHGVSFAIWI